MEELTVDLTVEDTPQKKLSIELYNESCFDLLARTESNSIDLVLIDPPYPLGSIPQEFFLPAVERHDYVYRLLKYCYNESCLN